MRTTSLIAALALGSIATEAGAAADPARYMPAQLVAETLSPKPGTAILLGIKMSPKPGWHGYWSNPGEAGIATSVQWSAPAGISVGPLLHPSPSLMSAGRIASFVHEGPHILLARMRVADSIAPGTRIPLKAKLSWAACTESQCVPLHATLSIDLVTGGGAAGANADELRSALSSLPRAAPAGSYSTEGKSVRLELPPGLGLRAAATHFFPDDNAMFATATARAVEQGGRIAILGTARSEPHGSLSGVVSDGRTAYRIRFGLTERVPGAETPATAEKPEPAPSAAPVASAGSEDPNPAPGSTPPVASQDSPGPKGSWLLFLAGAAAVAAAALAFVLRRR